MADEIFVLSPNRSRFKDDSSLGNQPDADAYGRVLFRQDAPKPEPLDPELMKNRLSSSIKVVREALKNSGLSKAEVCLKFAADAKVGVAFLGETGLEASIEVKFEFDLAGSD